jgi:hypothetical protein
MTEDSREQADNGGTVAISHGGHSMSAAGTHHRSFQPGLLLLPAAPCRAFARPAVTGLRPGILSGSDSPSRLPLGLFSFTEREMSHKNRCRLDLERLPDRITPTTAVLSNGTLFIQGDNLGNNIDVLADANGNIHVTERGQQIAISGSVPATTATVMLIIEEAGTGNNNTLATDSSLGAIPDTLIGNGGGLMTFKPGNNAASNAIGSPNTSAVNNFFSNPGGKDVFTGGKGYNLFDWEPGTGTDVYNGAGKDNRVLVDGNNNGQAENDTLMPDGTGGVTFTRTNLVPFSIYTKDIQGWVIHPSSGAGNVVTVGNLTGTATKRVEVDASQGTISAGSQKDANVRLVVDGTGDTITEGAGPSRLENVPPSTDATLLAALEALARQNK